MRELLTLSAKTVMNTRSSMLSKYLDTKQDRRRKARYRQKRLDMGLSATVPLKRVSLDSEERATIASTELIGTARRKRHFANRHFAWPVSLGIHIFVGFLLTIYAVREYIPEDVPVSLAFVEPIREPRDIRRRSPIKPSAPPKTLQLQPKIVPRSVPREVEIPREEARFYTPEDDLADAGSGPAMGGVSIPEGLGNIQVEQGRAEIPTEAPKVDIDRSTSIAPDDTDIEIPDAGLSDVSIDAEVAVEVDQRPRVLRKVDPRYPDSAKRANREAVVTLEFTVDVDGKAVDIKVVKPVGYGFDEAAVEAIKKWRFTPAKRGGEDVPMRVQQRIRFTLEEN